MELCEQCNDLAGMPSTALPHSGLVASGVGAFGAPRGQMEKAYDQWKCSVCGNRMYQGTEHDDPPLEWRTGEKPADWKAISGES